MSCVIYILHIKTFAFKTVTLDTLRIKDMQISSLPGKFLGLFIISDHSHNTIFYNPLQFSPHPPSHLLIDAQISTFCLHASQPACNSRDKMTSILLMYRCKCKTFQMSPLPKEKTELFVKI